MKKGTRKHSSSCCIVCQMGCGEIGDDNGGRGGKRGIVGGGGWGIGGGSGRLWGTMWEVGDCVGLWGTVGEVGDCGGQCGKWGDNTAHAVCNVCTLRCLPLTGGHQTAKCLGSASGEIQIADGLLQNVLILPSSAVSQ